MNSALAPKLPPLRPIELERIAAGYYRFDQPHWDAARARWYESDEYRMLTPRWTFLTPHPIQLRLVRSDFRFKFVPKGRRSGGSERSKRYIVSKAMRPRIDRLQLVEGRLLYGGPTHDQAKGIAWDDLNRLTPKWALDRLRGRRGRSDSELTIYYKSGILLRVAGMDRPERVEGQPWDGGVFDEFQEFKPDAFPSSIRPMLSTPGRFGWGIFCGRPKGRNHYYDLLQRMGYNEQRTNAAVFGWPSWDILPESEIEDARDTLDARMFAQEYGAEFVHFAGRVYEAFERTVHAAESLAFNPDLPLILCFDFNVSPGICAYLQELPYQGSRADVAGTVTAVFGEVWIDDNSSTGKVIRKILADFGPGGRFPSPRASIYAYGDASGGNRTTAQVAGSDWDQIKLELGKAFPGRFFAKIPPHNPEIIARVNAVNWSLRNASGVVRMLVDPVRAPHVCDDLEQVTYKKGEDREIDKPKSGPGRFLTHLSDAIGYYLAAKHPIRSGKSATFTPI